MSAFRRLSFILTTLLLAAIPAANTSASTQWSAHWEPASVVNGSPVLFRVTAPAGTKDVHGDFLGQALDFRYSSVCHCWYALAGVGLNYQTGQIYLAGFRRQLVNGKERLCQSMWAPRTILPVRSRWRLHSWSRQKSNWRRSKQDQEIKKQAFAATLPEPLWSGRFQPPAAR